DPSDPAFDHLAVGDSVTITVSYNVTDAQGDSVAQSETITITGTNDVPEVSATNSVATDEDTASVAIAIGATDKDDGDTLTYSLQAGGEPAHGDVTFDQNAD